MQFTKLKKLAQLAFQLPIYVGSLATKKDPNLWVFGSWKGELYNDNSKYLFEYIIENKKDIRAIWVTKNRKLLKELHNSNKPAVYCYNPRGIYTQLKAGACFFTQFSSLDFLGSAIHSSKAHIQLWHGMPLKKILLDDHLYVKQQNSCSNKLITTIFPWTKHRWDIVISSSKMAESLFRSAFGDDTKIINSGFPRNKNFQEIKREPATQDIKKIIYMPTFRGRPPAVESNQFIERYLIDNGFNFQLINELCAKNNQHFYLKLHPANELSPAIRSEIEILSNIHFLDSSFDFYEEVNTFDLLITDYSSVFFDFVLTDKPVLHVAFDLDDYLTSSRELYFNYEDIRVGKTFSDWLEVFNYINTLKKSDLIESENYQKILSLMTAETSSSCEHIYREVKQALNY